MCSLCSKADKILAKAVEIERQQANNELKKVRETMKDILERERMLMRGRLADKLSSKSRQEDLDQDTKYIESEASLIEDGSSDTEAITDMDGYDEDDSIWGRRQRYTRRDPNF